VKNLRRHATLDAAGLGGPFECNPLGGGLVRHLAFNNSAKSKLPEYLVVRDAFATVERTSGTFDAAALSTVISSSSTHASAGDWRQRFGHHFKQVAHDCELFGGEHVE
jgi:hypothetical protein